MRTLLLAGCEQCLETTAKCNAAAERCVEVCSTFGDFERERCAMLTQDNRALSDKLTFERNENEQAFALLHQDRKLLLADLQACQRERDQLRAQLDAVRREAKR